VVTRLCDLPEGERPVLVFDLNNATQSRDAHPKFRRVQKATSISGSFASAGDLKMKATEAGIATR